MLNNENIRSLLENYSGESNGVRLYLLVDHAGMPGLVKKLSQARVEWENLFEGSKEENALVVAPILFHVEMSKDGIQQRVLFDWICMHGTYSSSMIFLATSLSLEDLARRLALRLEGVLPENVEVMLRFFDPRVFEQLIAVMDVNQKQNFLSVAHCWWFVDRRGKLHQVNAIFSDVEYFLDPLEFDLNQQNGLLDASELDQVVSLLRSSVPELYMDLPLSERYDFIVRHIGAARLLGIHVTHELALYCALALLYGENFSEENCWKSALQDVRTGVLNLKQAAEKVEIEIF